MSFLHKKSSLDFYQVLLSLWFFSSDLYSSGERMEHWKIDLKNSHKTFQCFSVSWTAHKFFRRYATKCGTECSTKFSFWWHPRHLGESRTIWKHKASVVSLLFKIGIRRWSLEVLRSWSQFWINYLIFRTNHCVVLHSCQFTAYISWIIKLFSKRFQHTRWKFSHLRL